MRRIWDKEIGFALFGELTEIQTRGMLAAAFMKADIVPSPDHMKVLTGESPVTACAIGEISYLTGMVLSLDGLLTEEPAETENK